ncbi:uncharacterized protein A1O5_02133 [Cladophialophora psammophila CBS 110553]|uniref:Uncharacterized protein n=1 Tax=Cladophialophora psammophila CBS 110553 TaxID=1182543 RepID=W9X4L2_9EURO|nr:uncharacterized protein A1O5_02133 [Cladophialophora psammophila CBS 110553]EXJ75437.1 hypothetical protein A1O5_02133 [Cladophialophora psammophila CBS 110553]
MAKPTNPKVETKVLTSKVGQSGSPSKTPDILWKEAVQRFLDENHIRIETLELNGDFGDADDGVEKASKMFQRARHPKNKTDKVIKAVGGCLDFIDGTVDFLKDSVPDGYGTPAKIIAGTISYMIQAAKNMTEDFDLIEETFDSIHQAIKDIGLLKDRHTQQDHFTSRLMDIFLKLFEFCQYSTKMFKEYSRKRLYITALMKGRNKNIQNKCDEVNKAILLFRATVPLKILEVTIDMNKKIDDLPSSLVIALQRMNLKASEMQQILGPKKSITVERIMKTFKDSGLDVDAKRFMEKQMNLINTHIAPDTFLWLRDEPSYKSWLSGQASPFIYISGSSGAGKTYLTCRYYSLIQANTKANQITAELEGSRQSTSVACFLFESGKEDSQSFQAVLATLILQIAEQDPKLCESMGRELEKMPKGGDDDLSIEYLWKTLILKKFEKASETSRTCYLLLDGVEQMKPNHCQNMLKRFQALDGDKHCIRIMMTGPPIMHEKLGLKSLLKINLDEKTKSAGDISKIIDHRIKNSKNLKNCSAAAQEKIKAKLYSWKESAMSSVDLMLSVMEDSGGDEAAAMTKLEGADSPEWLYRTMIEIVKAETKRSGDDQKSLEKLFAWCTYAKQPLRVDQLEHLWALDTSSDKFDVRSEIEGKSSSLLYTKKTADNRPTLYGDTDTMPMVNIEHEYVFFRQAAFKEYLETNKNKMIEDPIQERVNIFVTLCEILCGQNAVGDSPRQSFREYATVSLMEHFRDIDIRQTSPKQSADVVEALSRVLSNDNNVCAVFEAVLDRQGRDYVEFDLYDTFRPDTMFRRWERAGTLLVWAKKLHFYEEEELSFRAREWVEASIKAPQKMLETLGRGHLENWAQAVTEQDAVVPYTLAYRALSTTGIFADVVADTMSKMTTAMLEYGREHCFKDSVKLSRARISAALLLNTDSNTPVDRDIAAKLYETNIKLKDTPGPEKFYSSLGLAEYHANTGNDDDPPDLVRKKWEMVQKHTGYTLQQWTDEKGALGSELNNERCTEAYLLEAQAWSKLDKDDKALETCKHALQPGALQFSSKILEFLTMIVEIYFKRKQFARVIDEVQQQSHQIKCEWMLSRSEYLTDKDDRLRQAAVLSRRVDVLIQLWEEAIDYWQQLSPFAAGRLRVGLAIVYRHDARTTKMAEAVLDSMIVAIMADPNMLKGGLIQSIFPTTVDIIYENFSLTSSDETKKRVLTKLENLINEFAPTVPRGTLEQMHLARAMITLAKMQRKSGAPEAAKEAAVWAERAFQYCIADLEDSVGSNDCNAFRSLAKVLMFAGLKTEAVIALSLWFSEVREYDDSQPRPLRSVDEPAAENIILMEEEDVAAEEAQHDGLAGINPSQQTQAEDERNREDDPTRKSSAVDHEAPPQENPSNGHFGVGGPVILDDPASGGCHPPEQLEIQTREAEGSLLKASDYPIHNGDTPVENGILPEVPGDAGSQPHIPNGVGSEGLDEHGPPDLHGVPKPEEEEEEEDKEDLIEGEISCNGPCEHPPLTRWLPGVKFYYCLDCEEVDLCADCHAAQEKYFTEHGDGFWMKCCWARHEFLEVPIEGWKGVKDGEIWINDKKKSWVDWLASVKEKWNRQMVAAAK